MRITASLNRAQVETIHRNALRVLEEIGVRVEHAGLRDRLTEIGGVSDELTETVRFPPRRVESRIAEAPKSPPSDGPTRISMSVGIFQSVYLDPATDAMLPFDEDRLARYVALARSLPGIGDAGLLGVPFVPADIPARHLPLAEKLYAWKWGAQPGGSVHFTDLCAPLRDLFACHAAAQGKRIEEVCVAGGYLISPLKLARPECEQLLWFHAQGLRFFVGHLPMQGGTAPITLAGAIVLSLAEQMFLYLLQRALWEDAAFGLGGSVSTMDMRSGISCYGRPEQQRINAAFADIGRFYGCATGGHTGLADAKVPSFEAGAQKAAGALWTALACGHASVSAGLLSMDEVCSPVQMILDHDLAESLKALLAEPAVDEETCAFDEIAAVGIGGGYLGTDLTAQRFRQELFRPRTWSGEFLAGWLASGRRTDVDTAREIALDLMRRHPPAPRITEQEEVDLRRVIADAVRHAPFA